MKIDLITSLAEYFEPLKLSLIGKAASSGIIDIQITNLHDFGKGIHKAVDDSPYGGGSGMVLLPEVARAAIDSVLTPEAVVLIPSAKGKLFTQKAANELSKKEHLIFLNSRFEGYDARIVEHYEQAGVEIREYSIGDYVLFGAEAASLVMLEAAVRLIPGVLGNSNSLDEESFSGGLLEYNSYTHPQVWEGLAVPEVLLNGNHAKIAEFRNQDSLKRTQKYRPDLL